MSRLKKDHQDILLVLRNLGGIATIKQIADKTGLCISGVTQMLMTLQYQRYVCFSVESDGDIKWTLQ